MKRVILLLALCLAPWAHADNSLDGKWSGTGKGATWKGDWAADCNPMNLEIHQSATEFTVVQAKYACGQMNYEWSQAQFEIKGSDLYMRGTPAGHIALDHAEIEIKSGNFHWHVTFDLKDGKLGYAETQDDGTNGMNIQGTFAHAR